MSEDVEVKCAKCGTWWPKSYLIDGLCWLCDGRYQEFLKDEGAVATSAAVQHEPTITLASLTETYEKLKRQTQDRMPAAPLAGYVHPDSWKDFTKWIDIQLNSQEDTNKPTLGWDWGFLIYKDDTIPKEIFRVYMRGGGYEDYRLTI